MGELGGGRFCGACVQMNSGDDMDTNLERAADYARQAHKAGARLISFPENVALMSANGDVTLARAMTEPDHKALAFFRNLASELQSTLIVGSLHVKLPDEDRIANRCYVIGANGAILTSYDKIHMFDVDLANGESYRESKRFCPGTQGKIVMTDQGMVGVSICYDLRFPGLFRDYAKAGARILSIPAAFTRPTGAAHWHCLLRARAIENGCFVLAPAQCGEHPGKRKTYGHSLIIDPWGDILADGGTEPGFVCADIDLARIEEVRQMVPSLNNDQDYVFP